MGHDQPPVLDRKGELALDQFERILSNMDLVTREEFEAVQAMAAKARAEQEERAFNRRIREEQEQAFAEALAEDQRREREREAEVARLEKKLQKAHAIMDVQKKVAGLLGLDLDNEKDS